MGQQETQRRQQWLVAARRRAQAEWEHLQRNDPDLTAQAANAALRCANLRAVVDAVRPTSTSVIVVCEHLDTWVRDIAPSTTPAGRPTTKKRSKSQRIALYLAAVASHVLAAVKTVMAAAPGTSSVTCMAVQRATPGSPHDILYLPIYLGTFTRTTIEECKARGLWTDSPDDLRHLLLNADNATIEEKGRTRDLEPINADY